MDWFVIVLIIVVIAGIASGIEQFNQEEKIKQEEAENRELINKALKHYAETNGVK